MQKSALMERDARAMKKELRDGIDTIHDKDRRIAEGKNKVVELEKFKYVLQYKIGELQAQDQPRQERLAALQTQIKVGWADSHATAGAERGLTALQDVWLPCLTVRAGMANVEGHAKHTGS